MKIKAVIICIVSQLAHVAMAVNLNPSDPVCVKEVSFSGGSYIELTSDDEATTYEAPHWVKDGHNYSVSYTMSSIPKIAAKIKFPGCPNGTMVTIKAEGTEGMDLPEKTVPVNNECAEYPSTATEAPWPGSIKFYDRSIEDKAFKLKWKATLAGNTFTIGTTKHQVYCTLTEPVTSRREETVFYLACNDNTDGHGAAGSDLVDAIYAKFQSKAIHPIDPDSGDEDGGVTFKFRMQGGTLPKDASGVCGPWADFFCGVLFVHGLDCTTHAVNSNNTSIILPADVGKTISNFLWHVNTQPLINGRFAPGAGVDQGQGDAHTKTSWQGHVISSSYGFYYDASYGIGPCVSERSYEHEAVAGYSYDWQYINWAGFRVVGHSAYKNSAPVQLQLLNYLPPKP